MFDKNNPIQIPKIAGLMYHDIRESFTGGHTDVYIPHGENVKLYDVNSLYPYVMKIFDMPVGPINFFEGDLNYLNILEENKFGFFYVTVTTPDKLFRPLLQLRVKTNHGVRTVAPLGTWKMWIFSEEMKCYEKYGYKFEIHKGYLCKRAKIFTDFIDVLYNIKKNTPRSNPMYEISKLLMNSLYGRFGMDINLSQTVIIKNEKFDTFTNNELIEVLDFIDFENGKVLITFQYKDSRNDDSIDSYLNVNVCFASAITAYARVVMSHWLGDENIDIIFTDTDSICTSSELPTGNEIGQLKLEHLFKEVVCIANKVWSGVTNDGIEIVKVKGYKGDISFNELKSLLKKGSFSNLSHTKLYKNLDEANIEVINQLYKLQITDSKREVIFKNDIFTATKPYHIDDDKIIINKKIKK